MLWTLSDGDERIIIKFTSFVAVKYLKIEVEVTKIMENKRWSETLKGIIIIIGRMIRANVNYWRLSSLALKCIPRHETFILFVFKRVYLLLDKAELVWSVCITIKTNLRSATMNINLLAKIIDQCNVHNQNLNLSRPILNYDNAIRYECSRFSKKLCCRLEIYFFISWCFLSVSSSRSKYEVPTQKQQYCSHWRHKNIPLMSSKCDYCYFWPFIDFNIKQNHGMSFMAL